MDGEYTLMKIISDYKKILKRHLSCQDSCQRIKDLSIKRKNLRAATHADLLDTVNRILDDLNEMINSRPSTPTNYCGLQHFAKHIHEQINDHVLNDRDEVINSQQIACKAVIDTIQLINVKQVEPHLNTIQDNIHTAIKYGSREHKSLLIRALRKQSHEQHRILVPLVHMLESNVEQLAS